MDRRTFSETVLLMHHSGMSVHEISVSISADDDDVRSEIVRSWKYGVDDSFADGDMPMIGGYAYGL